MKKFIALLLSFIMVFTMIPSIIGPAVLAEETHHFLNCDDTCCEDEGCSFNRVGMWGHLLEDGHVYEDCFDVDCERCGIVTGTHHNLSISYNVPKGEYDKCQEIQNHCSRSWCDYYEVAGYVTEHNYLNCRENICTSCPYDRGPVSGSLYYYGHVYDDCFDVGCNRCPYIWTGTPPGHIYLSWTDDSPDLHKSLCIKCGDAAQYEYHTYPPEWSLFASDQHRRACTAECGHYEYEDHSFSSWTPYTTSLHQHTCTKCGFMQTSGHTYDNCLDTVCNDCGDDRDPAPGIANADGHAYIDCSSRYCSRPECGHDRGMVLGILYGDDHVYLNCQDTTCNRTGCGHTRSAVSHTYNSWVSISSSEHRRACTKCFVTQDGNHYYSHCGDASCNASCGRNRGDAPSGSILYSDLHVYYSCTDTTCNRSGCGHTRTAVSHTYPSTWKYYSANTHRHACTRCGSYYYQYHNWVNVTAGLFRCSGCGATKYGS